MTYVKFRKDPQMKYEVKGEDDTRINLSCIGWVPKIWVEDCDSDCDLVDVIDVAVYLTNNKMEENLKQDFLNLLEELDYKYEFYRDTKDPKEIILELRFGPKYLNNLHYDGCISTHYVRDSEEMEMNALYASAIEFLEDIKSGKFIPTYRK